MTSTTSILCRDCVHFLKFKYPHNKRFEESLGRCARSPIILNALTGTGQHRFCAQERHHGDCGPEGRKFERKVGAAV
jgi:hypothetical protein